MADALAALAYAEINSSISLTSGHSLNSAFIPGYINLFAPFESFSEVQIRQMTEINYLTPLRLTQYLIPWLMNIKESHIIYVSSMGGFQGSLRFPGLSVYSSNKSALSSLSESLAEEYKDTSMRFNTLALGAVDTEMLKESLPEYMAKVSAKQIAAYIGHFAIQGYSLVNGKVIPLAGINPSF
jgi:NAD(P)-dependent dehydrogenase (short-subunit alcohol dehydrogenase family)